MSRSGIRCDELLACYSQIKQHINKHIDSHARYQIQIDLAKVDSASASAIAQSIGYSVSTVYREIARNRGGADYGAKFAQ